MHPPLVRWRRVTPSQWRAISCHLRVGRAGWGQGPAFTHAPLACLITHKHVLQAKQTGPVYVWTMTCATLYTNFALPGYGILSVTLAPSSYNLLELAEVTYQKNPKMQNTCGGLGIPFIW